MEVRLDSNNVYYNYNNNRRDNSVENNTPPTTNTSNEQSASSSNTVTSNVTQLPRVELPPEEVLAVYSQRQETQINQGILNAYSQNNNSVDFASQSVEVSLRDINQLQQQLNRTEVLDNIASTPQSERGENLSEIDPEELEKLKEENQALSNEEAIALYYNRQAQESKEQQAQIYANNINNNSVEEEDSTTVDFNDINELQTTLNRTEVLDNIASTPQNERAEIPSRDIEIPENETPVDDIPENETPPSNEDEVST